MTLRTIRKAIMWLLDSDGELQELRSRKAADDPTAKRDQFYKLLSHDGGVVGFSYRCTCGTRYKLLDAQLWLTKHSCGSCGHPFSLEESCRIPANAPPSSWPDYFSQLPAETKRVGPAPFPRAVDTWDSSPDPDYGNEPMNKIGWLR
jgi:hypothetical protein